MGRTRTLLGCAAAGYELKLILMLPKGDVDARRFVIGSNLRVVARYQSNHTIVNIIWLLFLSKFLTK